ncbi:MAG: DUF3367 domain-containing protein, partial [Acidimicrobiia bacterium]|nr:DUF3367 domain-containing protein [Acidimicrobiia bacterium]
MTGVGPRIRRLDVAGLALLSYVPFLLSSPGNVSADTKPYLYLDPGRLLARSAYLWSDHLGTGTVPHQGIGYLFPMGPYYWAMDQLGVPDWVAQRLWMGSISFAAAVGALWLLTMLGTRRSGALVGALVYILTPYQVAFTARISVLLLPWAALPWLVGLTARALARRGWRDPALFALVALAAGSVNATALLLVGIAPVLWLVVALVQRRASIGAVAATVGRIGVLTIGVSLWWAVGLVLQSRYGFSVLDATESLARVSGSTLPADLVRGFGNWFLSGSDRLGPWLEQGADYGTEKLLTVATLGVPLLAFAATACIRWRHRAYFVGLVVVGVVVGVGAWPYGNPSPLGSVFKSFANGSALGLALRNTPRVVPVIVLGLAGLLAAGVSSLASRPRLRLVAIGAVVVCVVVGFLPVWRHGYLAAGVERPEDVPRYWEDAAAALDAEGDATRVLEIPGSLFSAYRWGNTVEPVTPGLMGRPYVARERLPYGTAASVNLLAALDRRIQDGTLDAASFAPMARFLRAGTISLRSDLQYARYDTPAPGVLWRRLTEPAAPGLGAPIAFGPKIPGPTPTGTAPSASAARAVALFPIVDAQRIVDAKPARRSVVLSGDGDGIVDATEAGLLDGRQLVQYAVTLDTRALRATIARDADLVLTDSARKRSRHWDVLRGDVGPTEPAGRSEGSDDPEDQRLDQIPGTTDADRTVIEAPAAQPVVRVSTRLLRRAGEPGQGRRLAIVLTRLRPPAGAGRSDREATLVRSFRLPRARGFSVAGTVRVVGVAAPVASGQCRSDLLTVDGTAVPVAVQSPTTDTTEGLTITSCGAPLALSSGRHEIVAAPGSATGFDVDQLVLTSAAGGDAATDPGARLGAPPPAAGARVRVVDSGPTSFDLKVRTDGTPFWLILGQSLSDGWKLQTTSGRTLGEPQLVDGFANGWLVKPGSSGVLRLELRWTPQRLVWWGLGLSVAAVLACLALLVITRRRRRDLTGLAASSFLSSPLRYVGATPSVVQSVLTGLGVGVVAALVARPVIGLAVGLA